MKNLKPGIRVKVYEDHIIKAKLEGEAKLIKLVAYGPIKHGHGERWIVEFEDGIQVSRLVNVSDIVNIKYRG